MNAPAQFSPGTPPVAEEVPRNYRELLKKANLSPDDLRELGRLRAGPVLFDFFTTLALMVAAAWLFSLHPGLITGAVCLLVTLHNFSRLASLVHASDHGYLLVHPVANNALGNICAYLMGYTRAGHRLAHQAHHSHLNTERDSDKVWGDPGDSATHTARKWLEDLFLVSALRRVMQYSQADKSSYSVSPWEKVSLRFLVQALKVQAPVIPVQLGLLALYWWIAGPYYYFLFHVLPLVTLYPAVIRLRSLVEHSFPIGYTTTDAEKSWVTRSTDAGLLERLVIAPLDGHYHFEHHLLPGVPYYNLGKAHLMIAAKGFIVPTAPGYVAFFLDKWRREKALAAPSGS
jgi:fatty acid desaturase